MHHYISPETKQQIREAVRSGKPRYKVAEDFGVHNATVCRLCIDLPKSMKYKRRLTDEEKENVRNLVKMGLSKWAAARTANVSYPTALRLTWDLKSSYADNRSIGENSIKLLRKMVRDGYVTSARQLKNLYSIHTLQQYFPIQKICLKRRTIYFLEDRKEDALRGFLAHASRVLEYNDLTELSRLFGVPLDAKMRKELISKIDDKRVDFLNRKIARKEARRGYEPQNPDFIGKFIPSELLSKEKAISCGSGARCIHPHASCTLLHSTRPRSAPS